jgi:hypothetical protein
MYRDIGDLVWRVGRHGNDGLRDPNIREERS